MLTQKMVRSEKSTDGVGWESPQPPSGGKEYEFDGSERLKKSCKVRWEKEGRGREWVSWLDIFEIRRLEQFPGRLLEYWLVRESCSAERRRKEESDRGPRRLKRRKGGRTQLTK